VTSIQQPFKASVVKSSMEANWIAPAIVPELPVPGTRGFSALLKELQPFQPDANRVFVEVPSTRLSDVQIRFGLRDGDIQLAFFYTGFRITVFPFANEYQKDLPDLAARAVKYAGEGDLLPIGARFTVLYRSHLQLEGASATECLRKLTAAPVGMEAESCTYRLLSQPVDGVISCIIRLDRSQQVPGGLFVECNIEMDATSDLRDLMVRTLKVVGHAIAAIDIKL